MTLLASLRVAPSVAYSTGSMKCQGLAQIISVEIDQFRKEYSSELRTTEAMIMIVDRDRDRMTPLRLPWTYQAMMYEHFDYTNGRVKYGGVANKEISLSEEHDHYFKANLYSDFGQTIAQSTKLLKEAAKERNESHGSLNTLAGMEYLVDRLPEIKRKVNLAQRHFEIVETLSEIVKQHKLLDLTRVETEIFDTKLGIHTFDVSFI
jgi:Sec1 family